MARVRIEPAPVAAATRASNRRSNAVRLPGLLPVTHTPTWTPPSGNAVTPVASVAATATVIAMTRAATYAAPTRHSWPVDAALFGVAFDAAASASSATCG